MITSGGGTGFGFRANFNWLVALIIFRNEWLDSCPLTFCWHNGQVGLSRFHWPKHLLHIEWPQLTSMIGSVKQSKQMLQVISSSIVLIALARALLEETWWWVVFGNGRHWMRFEQKNIRDDLRVALLMETIDRSCSWIRATFGLFSSLSLKNYKKNRVLLSLLREIQE